MKISATPPTTFPWCYQVTCQGRCVPLSWRLPLPPLSIPLQVRKLRQRVHELETALQEKDEEDESDEMHHVGKRRSASLINMHKAAQPIFGSAVSRSCSEPRLPLSDWPVYDDPTQQWIAATQELEDSIMDQNAITSRVALLEQQLEEEQKRASHLTRTLEGVELRAATEAEAALSQVRGLEQQQRGLEERCLALEHEGADPQLRLKAEVACKVMAFHLHLEQQRRLGFSVTEVLQQQADPVGEDMIQHLESIGFYFQRRGAEDNLKEMLDKEQAQRLAVEDDLKDLRRNESMRVMYAQMLQTLKSEDTTHAERWQKAQRIHADEVRLMSESSERRVMEREEQLLQSHALHSEEVRLLLHELDDQRWRYEDRLERSHRELASARTLAAAMSREVELLELMAAERAKGQPCNHEPDLSMTSPAAKSSRLEGLGTAMTPPRQPEYAPLVSFNLATKSPCSPFERYGLTAGVCPSGFPPCPCWVAAAHVPPPRTH